jgi:hypothetical protein
MKKHLYPLSMVVIALIGAASILFYAKSAGAQAGKKCTSKSI